METFDGEPEFRYSRENRLKSAPENVQDFYNGDMKIPPKGLLKTLFYSKTSRTMLVVLVFVAGVMFFVTILQPSPNEGSIGKTKLVLRAINIEDSIYTSVQFSSIDNKVPGNVFIVFSAYDSEGIALLNEESHGIYSGEETYFRTFFNDYDIISVVATVEYNNEIVVLTEKVSRQ